MTARKPWYFAMTLFSIAIALLAGGLAFAEEKAIPAKVAAVNGVTISDTDLTREISIYLQRAGRPQGALPAAQQDQIKAEILNGLIDQELLYQESRKLGIQIENKPVDDQLAAIKKRYPSETEFRQALDSMQMSEEQVKTQIERGLAIREVIDREVAAGIEVDEAESKAFYDANPQFFERPERVKASHILIKVSSTASEAEKADARKKIEAVRKQAESGGDFAELAKAHSEGPSNARGGDLGFFQRGQMVKPFEEAAFALEKNQLSGIVETQFGYHLIKVTDKQPQKKFGYADVKERLTARLKQDKVEKKARIYIDTLKKGAKIEKFL